MAYKILRTIKLGKKVLGWVVAMTNGEEAFLTKRKSRDHIYMGGHPISFSDAEKEGKLEWAVNEEKTMQMIGDGVKYVIIESDYYAKQYIGLLEWFLDSSISKRFRHYDKATGSPLDYQRSLNFSKFKTMKVLVTKL